MTTELAEQICNKINVLLKDGPFTGEMGNILLKNTKAELTSMGPGESIRLFYKINSTDASDGIYLQETNGTFYVQTASGGKAVSKKINSETAIDVLSHYYAARIYGTFGQIEESEKEEQYVQKIIL